MGHDPYEFARILENLISPENSLSEPSSSSMKPWIPNWVGVQSPLSNTPNPSVSEIYPTKKVAKPLPPPKPEEPYIALDQLGKEAVVALRDFFKLLDQTCPGSFRFSELRRQYHRRAKQLHPDVVGRDDGRFRKLAQSYARVRKILKAGSGK